MGRKLVQSDEEEDDVVVIHDDDDDDDVKPSKMKKPAAAKKSSPKKKGKSSKQVSDDDDDDDDDSIIDVDDDEDEEEEEENPKKKQKKATPKKTSKTTSTTTTTRKGTKMDFTSNEEGGSLPKTKKELAAIRKAAKAEKVFVIAAKEEEEGTQKIPTDHPIAEKYMKMTNDQLKTWLRANGQMVSGVKDALITRCIDGEINGRLPKCERCTKGRIFFDSDKEMYQCGGYFDDDAKMVIRCKFAEKSIKRQEWLDPENSVEEDDSQKKEEKVKEKAAAVISEEFLTKMKEVKDPKTASELIAKYCQEELKLSLPQDEKKTKVIVGTSLMSNRTDKGEFDVQKVIGGLMESHPPKTTSQGSNKGGDESDGPSCKVEANNPIAQLLDELATLEKKKGGENVGFKIKALKTAVLAIRNLSYEIVDGNAMGKPGKNKVDGIGKNTARTIQEFLDSGKTNSPYLEQLKKEVGGG